ncbi:glycosyl hydrolase family 8 [Paenibacillus motobuensis]|uniref:glycosyl hydrolase family 8 n=1 Tax=Paenibacillus TaxID=44249 RepID=UPI00203B37AB|nr:MULTISPECIES: glycosyl hydrolase family 8 [Paenibacillus]MCM3039958.1 glycosyl hydrolase family 8 [Paenibacillus lutimineralis]MCM3647062.1 glycosyl hydrolase family 8 [Paenibacillus motobuensis]
MKNLVKPKWRRSLSLLLIFMLLFQMAGIVSADGPPVDHAQGVAPGYIVDNTGELIGEVTAAPILESVPNATDAVYVAQSLGQEVIAQWVFQNEGDNGTFVATGGKYQSASILTNVGGVFENYSGSKQEISYQGWDQGSGKKYWLLTLSTAGFENIAISSEQNSSGSGPNDFNLQISTDQATWTDVENGIIQMNISSSYNCPNDTCKLKNLPLDGADDKELLYVRWIVNSNTPTNTVDNPSGIGGGGSSRIRNIYVTGDPISGKTPVIPTIDLSHLPKQGEESVAADAPLTIKFNKNISISSESSVSIIDGNGIRIEATAAVNGGNTLHINHPEFTYGATYTVSIPRQAIIAEDGVPLVRDISWSFTTQDSPLIPKLINMTFNADPRTGIAFAWYTDIMTGTKVQVVEASKMTGGVFPEQEAMEFTGTGEEIETFMSKADRSTGHKTKFISHKAAANHLKPGTMYRFRVGNGQEWSGIGSFTTDTEQHQPYRFIVGSDSQASSKEDFEPWADTFKKARDFMGDPKFLINAGDLVDNGDLEEQWQWMLGVAQDELLNVPFVPVLGGHEIQDYDGDETTPNNNFYNHFNLPRKVVAATHDGSVYAFEYGDALYMVYNSQFDGKLNDDGTVNWDDDQHEQFWNQVDWMRNTVAKSDKKWKFVTFHKSPYAAGDNSAQWEGERIEFYKKNLIPVFDELGIDMVFEAHDHMYMRSFQMYGDQIIDPTSLDKDGEGNVINPRGTVYLMSNAFGNKFYYKNYQYELDENWEPQLIYDENGDPIWYDDYFAAVDEQPEKKMFTDVSISDQVMKFTAYTAAVEDEGQAEAVGNGLIDYDNYGIKRTDSKPNQVEAAKVILKGNNAVLTWTAPKNSKEPVRGFRIYEKNDKIKTYWSKYITIKEGQTDYSYTVEGINPGKNYDFIIKSVGRRDNSAPVEVSTLGGPVEQEPPSAPSNLEGTGASAFQINLNWNASPGTVSPSGYHIYRDGLLAGTTEATSYNDIGLKPDTSYRYVVKAFNAEGIESLASNEIVVKTKQASAGEGPHKAFPQHTSYVQGSIKPNHVTQEQMDQTVERLYDEWKAKYLKKHPYLQKSDPDQYYVWYADGDWFEEEYDEELGVEYMATTVSEAHGYGMLITALMGGHDPDAKKYFDGLFRYFKAHPSEIDPNLMAWKQGDTGTAIVDVDGVDSATDGDMDIAYALLLADSQWGSSAEINYLAEAKKVINAIMDNEVNQIDWMLRIADWATSGKWAAATRPSDFMLQHMKDYRNVTGDSKWDRVVDTTYGIINELYSGYSPDAGLLPDFVLKSAGKFVPAEPNFLESEYDGDYSYNSSRTPWRIGTDYLVTGDARAKDQLNTLNRWIRGVTNGDPDQILAGYKLDGSKALEEYGDITFSAPLMVSAMIDSSNQEWLNKLWDHNAAVRTEDDVYFGNNLRLLSMIVVSGNWWTPTIVDTEAPTEPTIERAEAVSSTVVDLKWTPSSDNLGVTGYKVYRNDQVINTTTKTEYRDTGLSAGTTYKYFVVAFDAAGNLSKMSNIRYVTTLQTSGGGGSPGGSTGGSNDGGSPPKTTVPGSGTDVTPEPDKKPETPAPAKKSFSDVGEKYLWAKNAIEELAGAGIIKGTTESTFEPGKHISRADFIVMLVRALGLEADFDANFTDVASDAYYYEALGIAKQLGIATGIGGNKFEPKAEISRQDMMVLTARALKLVGKMNKVGSAADLSKFTDSSKLAEYAVESVASLAKAGIILGDGRAIHPVESATRAEVAVMIHRIYARQ